MGFVQFNTEGMGNADVMVWCGLSALMTAAVVEHGCLWNVGLFLKHLWNVTVGRNALHGSILISLLLTFSTAEQSQSKPFNTSTAWCVMTSGRNNVFKRLLEMTGTIIHILWFDIREYPSSQDMILLMKMIFSFILKCFHLANWKQAKQVSQCCTAWYKEIIETLKVIK